MADPVTTPLQLTIHPLPQAGHAPTSFWSSETPSFKDFLDLINPLQHIPGISTLYQSLTGDIPSTAADILGGGLFGGPIGLVASVFDSAMQQETGKGVGGNLFAAVTGQPIPALQSNDTKIAIGTPPDHLGANQRAAFNAYVNASMLA